MPNYSELSILEGVQLAYEVWLAIEDKSTKNEIYKPLMGITDNVHPVLWLKNMGVDMLTDTEKECLRKWSINHRFQASLMECSLRLDKMGLLTDRSNDIISKLIWS